MKHPCPSLLGFIGHRDIRMCPQIITKRQVTPNMWLVRLKDMELRDPRAGRIR